jgi:hypothetical protein
VRFRLWLGSVHEEIRSMKMSSRNWISRSGTLLARVFGFVLLISALAAAAFAGREPLPEIDPGLATSAMALLSGGLLIIAGRARRH